MMMRACAGGFLLSLTFIGCGDDSEPTVDTNTPDTVEVSETTTEVDASGMTGEVQGRWAMLETQTALVTTQLLGTQLRAAFDEYLRRIRADGTYDRMVNKYYPGIRRYFPEFFAKQA